MQRGLARLTKLDECTAQAAHDGEIATAEFERKLTCEHAALVIGHETRGSAPGRARDLVVGIVQVTRRDRLVAVRLGELRERVQGLAAGLRCRRGCLLSHAPQHEIARQPRQSPGEHVAHIEVGFDRAAPEQHLEIAGVGVRAGGQCRLQPGRRVIGGERRLKCSC